MGEFWLCLKAQKIQKILDLKIRKISVIPRVDGYNIEKDTVPHGSLAKFAADQNTVEQEKMEEYMNEKQFVSFFQKICDEHSDETNPTL